MLLDLDNLIFIGFLLSNLAIGLFYSKGVKSTTEYAIGNRDFSTNAITTTIVATCMGAGIFSTSLSGSYSSGLYFIIPMVVGTFFALMATGYLLVPRMGEFFGCQSVAAAMGKIYGKNVRIVTAISGVLLSIGTVALQFKAATIIFQMLFNTSGFYSAVSVAIVVIIYSSIGGIKTVTFTDILQFFTFATIIPLIGITIWRQTPDNLINSLNVLFISPLFDLKQIFDLHNPRLVPTLTLMIVFSIPGLDPAFFQRILMSQNISQAKKSFATAGIIVTLITLLICYIGVLLIISDSNLNPNTLLAHIIENYTYAGFKGLVSIGIMSIIMSTADSYINSASVLVAHDILGVDNKTHDSKKELLYLRLTALGVGFFAFILAYNITDMLSLLVKTFGFYAPVVSTSLLLTIFGFRSSSQVVLMGMGAAAGVVIFSELYQVTDGTIVGVVGMLANLITYMIAHWFYSRHIGQRKSKNTISTRLAQLHKLNRAKALITNPQLTFSYILCIINNISLQRLYKENFINQKNFYQLAGFLSVFFILTQSYLIKNLSDTDANLYMGIAISVLTLSFGLIIVPNLPSQLKKDNIVIPYKMLVIPYVLVFAPILLFIISKFAYLQAIILLLSIIVFVLIVRWKMALVICIITGLICFQILPSLSILPVVSLDIILKLKIAFILIFTTTILIAFFKPKQEAYDLSEKTVDHLSHAVEDQKNQILDLSNLKQVFLRNLQHETNTPLTGVYSMSQALSDCYDKLDEEQRKNAIYTISSSSARLLSYVQNMFDVSKLISTKPHVNMRETNLSNLVYEVLRKCKKIYIPRKTEADRDFILNIESNVISECDEYYLRRGFENLIINAIQYCNKGVIEISLSKSPDQNKVIFSVKDSGIGIPEEDMSSIFEPFVTSSKTLTPAGGRGLGLSFVKEVARMHMGEVTVTSDGSRGSCFTMSLFVI